jgi:nucleoside 2-deoxyribosyltransferase
MLISAPADVPDEDLGTVKRTVSQWNLSMGRASNVAVLPMSWNEHAVAEFGERPQAVLNEQLVDEADMALALFADRLGTPTGEADSGTLEEIDRLVDAGKPVCVLVNRAPRSLVGIAATQEKERLEKAIERMYQRAIVLPYVNQAELVGHLNNMLSRAAGKVEGSATTQATTHAKPESVGVWPHIVRETYQETDSRGQLKTKSRYFLEIRNETGRPVMDVTYEIPGGESLRLRAEEQAIELMAPGQVARFGILLTLGSQTGGLNCTVQWRFPEGEFQQSSASLIF